MKPRGTPNAVDRHVGRRLYQLRRDNGLTQRHLAAAVGITYQQVQKYETGVNRIGAGRLWAISEALGVPVTFFFIGIESAEKSEPVQPIPGQNIKEALQGALPDEAVRAIAGLCKAIAQSKR